MEQQEEKKIQRRQSPSSSKPNSSIPIDLVSEILLKLPVKSIVRSRCVSKLWSSITTDSFFITSYETRFRPKKSLLVFFRLMDKFIVFTFPQHDRNLNVGSYTSYSSQHVDCYQMKYPKYLLHSSTESVQGLICFRTSATPIIWNPSKRQFLTLPKPDKSWKKGITVLLGYDPIEGKHKVVCMPSERFCNECMVLTLGSQELSWRRIKTNLCHRPFPGINNNARCINGVLYYKSHLDFDDMEQHVVMSFDIRSETFQPIRLPLEDTFWVLLIAYEGRIAFIHGENEGKSMKMWVLENAEKAEWSDKSIRASVSHYDQSLQTTFQLRSFTDGGEFIYMPSTCVKSYGMLYFDPKRDSFRKVVYEGIADEEFRLSTNGLGNRRIYKIQHFPNHIDSLIT